MTTIGELCMRDVVVGTSEMTLAAAAKLMRHQLIAFDDLLELVTEQLSDLTKVVGREQAREATERK